MARIGRSVAVAALACLLPLIAGCGGGDDDAAPPVSAADEAALERLSDEISQSASKGDAARFCAIVQPSLVDEAFGGARGCIRVIDRALRRNSDLLGELDIARITVDGEGAIVTYEQNPPGDVLFVREEGEWYLALNELALQQGATGETGAGS